MKFKARQLEVEAVQYLREDNIGKCLNFCKLMEYNPETNEYHIENEPIQKYDWIIKGLNGEFYTCNQELFHKFYKKL